MWETLFRDFSFLPEQASAHAGQVDLLYFFCVAITAFFTIMIPAVMVFVAIKFKRQSEEDSPKPVHGSVPLEIVWSVIPFMVTMVLFGWGAWLFFDYSSPPPNSLDVHVVGKQWMWKIQHPEGKREINQLHVPVNQPVRLIITSEDVLHSFYLPVFRVKRDAVPGRYQTMWFEATKTGEFHLFCAEYCGTEHSLMIGSVIVMAPDEYDRWLQTDDQDGSETPVAAGERLFSELRCDSCHNGEAGNGPSLDSLYRSRVTFTDGTSAIADEAYIRESIVDPRQHTVAGFGPMMPTFQGQVNEEQVFELISYIKTLGVE
jgi:cytochrome c oxidase subunit 2